MSHDADCPQGMRVQLKVDFHRFTDGQLALNERAKAAFADVETDTPRGLDSTRRQVAHGYWNAAQHSRVPSYGRVRIHNALRLVIVEPHRI